MVRTQVQPSAVIVIQTAQPTEATACSPLAQVERDPIYGEARCSQFLYFEAMQILPF